MLTQWLRRQGAGSAQRTMAAVAMVAAVATLIALAGGAAAQPRGDLLWPDGAPGAQGTEEKDIPTVTVFLPPPERANGAAVVICPGGGYGMTAIDKEGYKVAQWLNTFGVAGFVLDYRHSGRGYGHPAPLADVQRAMRFVRAGAEGFRVDPARVGVMGFSAGGHLASTAGTLYDFPAYEPTDEADKISCRPDFMILVYPVIASGKPHSHVGSFRNLLGAEPDPELLAKMSTETQVTDKTPPTFLVHGTDDTGVPVENSIEFFMALRRHGVPAELHCYKEGPHGFGLGVWGGPVAGWPLLCKEWMDVSGFLD